MNTADISVLSNELAVTLNPLRRGAQRAQAACAKLVGLALPWTTSSAGTGSRHHVRPGSAPARWPFPPAPAQDVQDVQSSAPAARERGLDSATVEPVTARMTRKAMLIDVAMVAAWGAIIPGLMWLGAAVGF